MIPATTDFRLSFLRITSEECFATSEPSSFRVKETSALSKDLVSAGFIPVAPITKFSFLRPVMRRYLISEEAQDIIFKSLISSRNSDSF